MEEKTQKTIRGLGLTFKIIAGFMFISGLFGCLMFLFFSAIAIKNPIVFQKFLSHSSMLSFVLKNFIALALIQCTMAVVIFITSIHFGKMQHWAKVVLETFSWLLIPAFIYQAILISASKPIFVKISSVISMIPWMIGVGILIWFLRKKEIRESFKR